MYAHVVPCALQRDLWHTSRRDAFGQGSIPAPAHRTAPAFLLTLVYPGRAVVAVRFAALARHHESARRLYARLLGRQVRLVIRAEVDRTHGPTALHGEDGAAIACPRDGERGAGEMRDESASARLPRPAPGEQWANGGVNSG